VIKSSTAILRSVKSLSVLGIVGAIKLFFSHYTSRNYRITPRGYNHALIIRGSTSDPELLYMIICMEGYKIHSDQNVRTVIDAGANVGYSAVYFAHRFPQATIVAIEPEDSNYQILVKNTRHYPNIVTRHAALWPEPRSLYVVDGLDCEKYSFTCETRANNMNSQAIRSCTMQQIVDENKFHSIDIVKVDIEGGEKELFSKNIEWLNLVRTLFIEVHSGCWKVVFNTLSRFEYDCRLSGEILVFRFRPCVEDNCK